MELKRKQIKGMYKNIIKISYCELSELLAYSKKWVTLPVYMVGTLIYFN